MEKREGERHTCTIGTEIKETTITVFDGKIKGTKQVSTSNQMSALRKE